MAIDTAIIVGAIVAARAVLVAAGVDGMTLSPLTSSIVAGGVFVMGLVVAGTLSDYKDADRAPADMATELYGILRDCESMDAAWNKPDMALLRQRLIAVVTALRADFDAGNTRECQQAVEDLSASFLELEDTDVPANYIVRLRQEQSVLRKAVLHAELPKRESQPRSARRGGGRGAPSDVEARTATWPTSPSSPPPTRSRTTDPAGYSWWRATSIARAAATTRLRSGWSIGCRISTA